MSLNGVPAVRRPHLHDLVAAQVDVVRDAGPGALTGARPEGDHCSSLSTLPASSRRKNDASATWPSAISYFSTRSPAVS